MEEKEPYQLIDGGKMMPLLGHLSELRSRIIKAFIAIFILFCIAMFFSSPILNFLKQPLLKCLPDTAKNLHFTGPLDVLLVGIRVSFFTSVILGCPIWLYQFWKFFEPALYEHERKRIIPFIVASVLLFFTGVLFCFYFILPMTFDFLIGIGLEVGAPIITVTDYISVVTLMILGFGLVFETPLILVLLASLDLITHETLAKHRRVVVVLALIIGALLTPPDPLSQVAMAVPLYIMYEISILIIRWMKKGKSSEKKKNSELFAK